jgi:hypothetical protein
VIAAQNLKLLDHVSIPPATGIFTLVLKSEKFLHRSQHKLNKQIFSLRLAKDDLRFIARIIGGLTAY